MISDAFDLTLFTWGEVTLRLALAIAFGLALGLDRDSKNKPIDFRAYMIVCVATCTLAMMVQELHDDFSGDSTLLSLDMGKVISGVLTGIGFLGAGAIIKRDNDQVVGTATGASIWASGGIGLALGFGVYGLAFAGFLAVAAILIFGGLYMEIFHNRKDEEADLPKK